MFISTDMPTRKSSFPRRHTQWYVQCVETTSGGVGAIGPRLYPSGVPSWLWSTVLLYDTGRSPFTKGGRKNLRALTHEAVFCGWIRLLLSSCFTVFRRRLPCTDQATLTHSNSIIYPSNYLADQSSTGDKTLAMHRL